MFFNSSVNNSEVTIILVIYFCLQNPTVAALSAFLAETGPPELASSANQQFDDSTSISSSCSAAASAAMQADGGFLDDDDVDEKGSGMKQPLLGAVMVDKMR